MLLLNYFSDHQICVDLRDWIYGWWSLKPIGNWWAPWSDCLWTIVICEFCDSLYTTAVHTEDIAQLADCNICDLEFHISVIQSQTSVTVSWFVVWCFFVNFSVCFCLFVCFLSCFFQFPKELVSICFSRLASGKVFLLLFLNEFFQILIETKCIMLLVLHLL